MVSKRFGKPIRITNHARASMEKREIGEALLFDIIESGDIKPKGGQHLWIYKRFADRNDNLLCVASVNAEALIVKTVMIDWTPREIPR